MLSKSILNVHPLVYILMSNRMQITYEAVFEGLKKALEERGLNLAVEAFLMDYEPAAWNAVKVKFGIQPHGCAFHWAQAVQKNTQKSGVELAAENVQVLFDHVQQLKQFQLLSATHIRDAFSRFKAMYANHPADHVMNNLLVYFEQTWILSSVHPPETWSQYGVTIRTNNGIEGWHMTMNKIFGRRPHLYTFIRGVASNVQSYRDDIAANDFHRPCRPKQAKRDERLKLL